MKGKDFPEMFSWSLDSVSGRHRARPIEYIGKDRERLQGFSEGRPGSFHDGEVPVAGRTALSANFRQLTERDEAVVVGGGNCPVGFRGR